RTVGIAQIGIDRVEVFITCSWAILSWDAWKQQPHTCGVYQFEIRRSSVLAQRLFLHAVRPSESRTGGWAYDKQMEIRSFQAEDEQAVVSLWKRCGLVRPWNDPHRDISRKLGVRGDLFLVGVVDGEIVATAMVGYEGHRGWVNYLAVRPEN